MGEQDHLPAQFETSWPQFTTELTGICNKFVNKLIRTGGAAPHSSDLAHLAGVIILEGLLQFFPGVHHEWAIARNRLANWLTCDQEQVERLVSRV
jgi:hypothetical protein